MMTVDTPAQPGDTCIIWIARDETERGVVNRGVPGQLVEHLPPNGWAARFHPELAADPFDTDDHPYNWGYSELDWMRPIRARA